MKLPYFWAIEKSLGTVLTRRPAATCTFLSWSVTELPFGGVNQNGTSPAGKYLNSLVRICQVSYAFGMAPYRLGHRTSQLMFQTSG